MKILSFDLSSKCIGITAAIVNNGKVEKMQTTSIIPPKFNAEELGFLASKKKLKLASGKEVYSYSYKGETSITMVEKRKRDNRVRDAKNNFIINDISKKMEKLITKFSPSLILVEKNEVFNGILTSILLARINGVLLGIAGAHNIRVTELHVREVRKPYNVMKLVAEFVKGKSSKELSEIPDIAKRAIRVFLEKKYNHKFLTDDESDSCIVLDYYINYLNGGDNNE